MSGSSHHQEVPARETALDPADIRPEPMGDEEKILAGRQDVNMPALLTKDVQGG